MNVGDRVKVTRLDQYTMDCIVAAGVRSPIGMSGVVVDIRYNHNMHQWEVIVDMEGSEFIWEPWNLSVIKEPGQ